MGAKILKSDKFEQIKILNMLILELRAEWKDFKAVEINADNKYFEDDIEFSFYESALDEYGYDEGWQRDYVLHKLIEGSRMSYNGEGYGS